MIVANHNNTMIKSLNQLNKKLNSQLGTMVGLNVQILLRKNFNNVQEKMKQARDAQIQKQTALENLQVKTTQFGGRGHTFQTSRSDM